VAGTAVTPLQQGAAGASGVIGMPDLGGSR
jgi:hypothetical protein